MAEMPEQWAKRVAKEIAHEALHGVEIDGKPLIEWIHEVMKRDENGAPVAHWLDADNEDEGVYFVCTRCDCGEDYKYPYCPNCGARMMP